MTTGFGERLEKLARNIGGVSLLARLAGISRRSLVLYMSGQVDPTRRRLINLAKAGGVNFEWLATGKGPIKGGNYLDDSFVLIPMPLESGGSADQIAASREFLRNFPVSSPDRLMFIQCSDHSMEPTINCGSFVLVDQTDRNFRSHDIVCLRSGGNFLFRRLITNGIEDEIILTSDRFPIQKTLTREGFENIGLVGKAVHVLQKLR